MSSIQWWFNVLTLIAIVIGPIIAVVVTRVLDDKRMKDARRMDVFRTLMRTRRVTLSPDHVGALNLVEIEFRNDGHVIKAWAEYFRDLGERWPSGLQVAEQQDLERKREAKLTKLLHAMANALKFNIEQMEIFEGGYAPQGWLDDEQAQRLIRFHLIEILSGRRAFPVVPYSQPAANAPQNIYPPPP
jgi:hypothetical protein